MSIFIGHARMHRWHIVHIQAHSESRISSSNPSAAIRNNFRGSISARPVAGQPDAQVPHVMQAFKWPPSGNSSITFFWNVLLFPAGISMGGDDMDTSFKDARLRHPFHGNVHDQPENRLHSQQAFYTFGNIRGRCRLGKIIVRFRAHTIVVRITRGTDM